jgi:uncharacterized RDD family membrane protein YckC
MRSLRTTGIRLLGIAVCMLVANFASFAEACPTCKNDLQHSGSEFGFAVSILFMMAVPFCIFAGWTVAIIKLRRQMALESPAELLMDK